MFRTIGFRFSGTAVSPHKNIQRRFERNFEKRKDDFFTPFEAKTGTPF